MFASLKDDMLSETWTRMTNRWCAYVKPYVEQILVIEGTKPSIMENSEIPVLHKLKRIVFGRIAPVQESFWKFRREKNTTFLAFQPDPEFEEQLRSFFEKYEGLSVDFKNKEIWEEFHAEIGLLLGYPKTAREAFGEGKITRSFYDVPTRAPWIDYPFASFSPAIWKIQEALEVSLKNEQILGELDLGEIALQFAGWFKKARSVWQKPEEGNERTEEIISESGELLEESKKICSFLR
jgi:hypothetical protein